MKNIQGRQSLAPSRSLPSSLGRRAFLKRGSLFLTTAAVTAGDVQGLFAQAPEAGKAVRVGMITDLHYADKAPAGTRHYRQTLAKLEQAAAQFERDKPQMVVELGDLIDAAASVPTEKAYLARINKEFAALSKDRHYVLGNHCVDTLTKEEFLEGVEQKAAHYSFDRGSMHFIVLDACYTSEGKAYGRRNFKWTDTNIPASEIEWLKADLKRTDKKVIVFAHQRLDVSNSYGVKNAGKIREIFEASGKVLAVFQGHSHKNDYKEIEGVHYCTLAAMVEGAAAGDNSFAVMDVHPSGNIRLTGHLQQKSYEWKR